MKHTGKWLVFSIEWCLFAWLFSMPLAWAKLNLNYGSPFSDSLDAVFWKFTLLTFAAYALPLLFGWYLTRRTAAQFVWWQVLISGLLTVAGICTWRNVTVGLGHLDCGYSCVDTIMPMKNDNLITVWLAIVLTLLVAAISTVSFLRSRSIKTL